MLNLWHDLPVGANPPEPVTAVIEIPSGSRNKYELDKVSGMLKLDRVLFSAVHYPGDYGFIPRTLHEDNDPLDVLVIVKEQTFPGCQIDVRPIGVLKMLDRGEPDDKILSVPLHDPYHEEYFDIADIPQHMLKEVEHFFHTYKDLEGKRVEILGWGKSGEAMEIINQSITRYQAAYGTKRELRSIEAYLFSTTRRSGRPHGRRGNRDQNGSADRPRDRARLRSPKPAPRPQSTSLLLSRG